MGDVCSEILAIYDLSNELLLLPVWDDYRYLFTASTNELKISGIVEHAGSNQKRKQTFPVIVNWPFFMQLIKSSGTPLDHVWSLFKVQIVGA